MEIREADPGRAEREGTAVIDVPILAEGEEFGRLYPAEKRTRVEITVDATAVLPDGRDAVRLTVYDDGRGGDAATGGGAGTTAIWQTPPGNGTLG